MTLEEKRLLLADYLAAEKKILDGSQEYRIHGRTFRRGDLESIQAGRQRLEVEISKAEALVRRRGRGRVRYIRP